MKIELTELGRHEAWLRLSSIMKAGDKHIQLERKLASELIRNWSEIYEYMLKELFKRIPENISGKAVEIITQGLANSLGASFGKSQKVHDELKKYITQAYQNGKSEFVTKPELKLSDKRAIEVLTKHNCFWLGEHYGKHIGGKIAELAQDAIRDGLGRDELANELREALGGKVGGYKYWDVASSAALVRSRSFGCVSGMVEAGIAEYEILAMGDERMCPICGELNGKVYSVSGAQGKIDAALGIEDSDKFKEAFPWPPGPGEDVALPPFHGRCRCVLVMSTSVSSGESEQAPEKPAETVETVETAESPTEMVRGVSQADIDERRGVRGHMGENAMTPKDILQDYARAGIKITDAEAQSIFNNLRNFTGDYFERMRDAWLKNSRGEVLSSSEKRLLQQYNLCAEYTKIAPTYQGSGKEIFRGVTNTGSEYSKMLLGLKKGDIFDLQMPSSFSTSSRVARDFAGSNGIMFHILDTDIKDAPSISGLAKWNTEEEILVNDRLWEVVKIDNQRAPDGALYNPHGDGLYHITLRRKKG